MAYAVHLDYGALRQPMFGWSEKQSGLPLWGLSAGAPFADPGSLPRHATQQDTKKLCDVLPLPGLNAVSERFKAVIEEFEAGQHQFFPIQLRAKDGTPYEKRYFIFNACKRLDAIDPELSQGIGWRVKKAGAFEGMPFIGGSTDDLVVSRPMAEGHHVWVSQFIVGGRVFFSDALKKRMDREKIRYLRYAHAPESDTAFDLKHVIAPTRDWLVANQADWVRQNRSDWLSA